MSLRYFSLHFLSYPKFCKKVLTNDKAFFRLSSWRTRIWEKNSGNALERSGISVLHSYTLTLSVNRDLKIGDGDDNENVKKAIGLISEITTLLVQHIFLYISLPFLLDCDVKLPNSMSYGERKQATTKIFFLSLNLDEVLRDSTPGDFVYIWQGKLVGITTMKIEKPRTHFLSDIFPAVAVLASYSYKPSLMFWLGISFHYSWIHLCFMLNILIYFSNQKRETHKILLPIEVVQVVHLAIWLDNTADAAGTKHQSCNNCCS